MKQKLYIVIKGSKNNVERESREWMQLWSSKMDVAFKNGHKLTTEHGNTIQSVGREEVDKHPFIP